MLAQVEVRRFTQGSHLSELAARHPVPPPWEDPIAEDLTFDDSAINAPPFLL